MHEGGLRAASCIPDTLDAVCERPAVSILNL